MLDPILPKDRRPRVDRSLRAEPVDALRVAGGPPLLGRREVVPPLLSSAALDPFVSFGKQVAEDAASVGRVALDAMARGGLSHPGGPDVPAAATGGDYAGVAGGLAFDAMLGGASVMFKNPVGRRILRSSIGEPLRDLVYRGAKSIAKNHPVSLPLYLNLPGRLDDRGREILGRGLIRKLGGAEYPDDILATHARAIRNAHVGGRPRAFLLDDSAIMEDLLGSAESGIAPLVNNDEYIRAMVVRDDLRDVFLSKAASRINVYDPHVLARKRAWQVARASTPKAARSEFGRLSYNMGAGVGGHAITQVGEKALRASDLWDFGSSFKAEELYGTPWSYYLADKLLGERVSEQAKAGVAHGLRPLTNAAARWGVGRLDDAGEPYLLVSRKFDYN